MAKILVVDDRPTNRQLLLTLLGYGGHELIEAADGAEALRHAYADHPDLVITDILMPTMSGYEFVQRLRADSTLNSTPVIFYTATYSEPQALKLAASCKVKIVLPKPCEPERILAAVNEALDTNHPLVLPQEERRRVAIVAREAMLAEDMLSEYLRDLNSVKQGFTEIIDRSMPAPTDLSEMESLSNLFSRTLASLSSLTARLSALVPAGLDLLQERDPAQAVSRCFDAACGVIGSTYAAIGVFDENEVALRFLLTKGLDAEVLHADGGRQVALLADLLEQRCVIRLKSTAGPLPGMTKVHPSITNFLGLPIASSDQVFGWMYFADRLGADEFTEEDERVGATLALQLALLYENFLLYDTLQNHAVQLQLEMAERQHAEHELRQLNESLEARIDERTSELSIANRELEAFSYSVSHDLRAPLTSIAGFTKLLLQEDMTADAAGAERRSFLLHIDKATQRTMTIVDTLLRLSQLSRQALDKGPVNMMALAKEVAEQLPLPEPARQIEVDVGTMPHCIGDEAMLKQVYVNLLSNAFKFTRHQTHAQIRVGWIQLGKEAAYFVADNGVGFNPQHAQRLFTAFQRDHSEAQFEGTGIGLSIVQRVVERHGGRVWAESNPGEGATFYFTVG